MCAVVLNKPQINGETKVAAAFTDRTHKIILSIQPLTIQRFNESLGEAQIPVTHCSD
jgi:hypothetical protein